MSNRVRTPVVFQSEAAECGAAALCAVFAYYGKYISLETMRRETEVSRDGCSAGAIMRAAKHNSLECHGFRKEPEALKDIKTPCILHWEFNHFVVFEGIKGNYAYINDPAIGRRKITLSELDRSFTGVVLTFIPEKNFKKSKPPKTFRNLMKKQIKFNRGVIVRLVAAGLLLVVPSVVIPMLSQVFIDEILLGDNIRLFKGLFCFLLGSVALYIILSVYRTYLLAAFRKKLVLLSVRELVLKILSLPVSFFEMRYAGDIADKVSSNSRAAAFVSDELANALLNILQVVACFTVMVIYSPALALAAFLYLIFNVIITRAFFERTHSLALEYRVRKGRFAGALCSGINISSTVKSCGAEGEFTSKLLGYNAGSFDSEQRLSRLQYIFDSLIDASALLSDAIILIIGGLLVINGRLTIGAMVAFSAVFSVFAAPLKSLAALMKRTRIARAELKRAEDIINYDDKSDEGGKPDEVNGKLTGRVEVRNLSFCYTGSDRNVITDISFKAECGESVAVVGASGSGKTTLLKLLCGLYSPKDGQITIDGFNINSIPDAIRSCSVSVAGQNPQLFTGTVRDNIILWDDSVTENDIIRAAKDACIHDFIMQKPEGYDFMITENGSNLSGGQRQRLEIAAALVKNPTVLIFDEATSSLDADMEKRIIDNIKRRGCTVITAAHRLSAIRDCDIIIVLKDGHIEETGTHPQLIKADGYYKTLIN